MILGIRADADRADYFVIHNDRKRALHFDETTRSRGRDATTVDSILEILARLLEQRRGARLARRKLDSGEYSGVIICTNLRSIICVRICQSTPA